MDVDFVNVFTCQGAGGNPCPIVVRAEGLTDADMQALAREQGHESSFVLSPPAPEFDYRFRYWVPNHEMEMCGHATVGALWLLARKSMLAADQVRIATLSGAVTGFVGRDADGEPLVEITQPVGTVRNLEADAAEAVCKTLGLDDADLLDLPIQNGTTSRVKTLVPVRDVDRLNAVAPDFPRIEALCEAIGSTGLYPYAPHGGPDRTFEARQFPKASGYPEDAATGIAAAALSFGLLSGGLIEANAEPIRIFQGRAMGRLSEIRVRLGFAGDRPIGCLLGGDVAYA